MEGWIKLHREIQNNWMYQEKRKFSKYEAWIDMIMLASHKDNKFLLGNELIEVKRGQFVTSIRKLGEKWSWSNTKVTSFLELLKSDGMIDYKKDTKKTLITLDNYGVYHDQQEEKTTQKEQEKNTKATQKHTIKNEKNVKNDKKEIDNSSSDPTSNENPFVMYQQCFGQFPSPMVTQEIGEYLDDGMEERLVSYAIYKAAKGGNGFRYANGILSNWLHNDILSYDQAVEEENNYKQQRMKVIKGGSSNGGNTKSNAATSGESITGRKGGRIFKPTRQSKTSGDEPI